jgi:phosphopantothenoylcysteine synthetase/decarboxylase
MTGADAPSADRILGLIVCGAGPASYAGEFVTLAQARHWDVHVIATPAGLEFIDVAGLQAQTGHPVRTAYRPPGEPRSATRTDVIIVAPATYNTINKWAGGISDNYALGLLAEAPGLQVPVIALPFVNTALAARHVYQGSVAALRAEGVQILDGDRGVRPHPQGTGAPLAATFPWHLSLDAAETAGQLRDIDQGQL